MRVKLLLKGEETTKTDDVVVEEDEDFNPSNDGRKHVTDVNWAAAIS